MSRIIEIKKSQIAFLRGLGKSPERMCQHFGVTDKEMRSVLTEFGFIKTRKSKNYVEPEYVIKTVNDVEEESTSANTVETQATNNQEVTEVEDDKNLAEIVSLNEN